MTELYEILKQQKSFLEALCARFDTGYEEESLRITLILRVLVHDKGTSHSLFAQLGIKNKLRFLDSALPIDPQPVGDGTYIFQGLPGLIAIKSTNKGGRFIAPLSLRENKSIKAGNPKGFVSFIDWWEEKSIPGEGKVRYSRKQLVLRMANKEGGAHVDKWVNKAYRKFTQSTFGMSFKINGIEVGFINNAADATVRQMAWEILESMKQYTPRTPYSPKI